MVNSRCRLIIVRQVPSIAWFRMVQLLDAGKLLMIEIDHALGMMVLLTAMNLNHD